MTPSDQADAARIYAGLLAQSRRLGGAFDHGLENNFGRNERRGIERCGDLLRIDGHFLKSVRSIQMLAAGHKPDLELFQVDHKRRVRRRPKRVKSNGAVFTVRVMPGALTRFCRVSA